MELIRISDKDLVKKEQHVINEAKNAIIDIIDNFKAKERDIGIELIVANAELREQQAEENRLNICPICKKGSLKITYSPKTKRQFVACDAYPNCTNTYTLQEVCSNSDGSIDSNTIKTSTLPEGIIFVDPVPSAFLFEVLTGNVPVSGQVTLSNGSQSKTIYVSDTGIISNTDEE